MKKAASVESLTASNEQTFQRWKIEHEVSMTKDRKKVNRKALSKRIRFEVFKRDSFTCQYCGRKAPDVILHVDHITPVSKGGTNDLLNLVTSCADCNGGKSDVQLDDNSALSKRQKQAEELQARREQIEMLRDWHLEIAEQHELELQSVNDLFCTLTNKQKIIKEEYLQSEISKLVRKYGVSEVMSALQAGYETYGDPHKALNKLDGILICRNDPETSGRVKLLNLMKYRLGYFDRKDASILLRKGYALYGEHFYSYIKHVIDVVSPMTWPDFCDRVYDEIRKEREGKE